MPRRRLAKLRKDCLPWFCTKCWITCGRIWSLICPDSELLVVKGFLALARPLYVLNRMLSNNTASNTAGKKFFGTLLSHVFVWFVDRVPCGLRLVMTSAAGLARLDLAASSSGNIIVDRLRTTYIDIAFTSLIRTSAFTLKSRKSRSTLSPIREDKYIHDRHNGHRSLV